MRKYYNFWAKYCNLESNLKHSFYSGYNWIQLYPDDGTDSGPETLVSILKQDAG
jgi:hypothetical protein